MRCFLALVAAALVLAGLLTFAVVTALSTSIQRAQLQAPPLPLSEVERMLERGSLQRIAVKTARQSPDRYFYEDPATAQRREWRVKAVDITAIAAEGAEYAAYAVLSPDGSVGLSDSEWQGLRTKIHEYNEGADEPVEIISFGEG